MARHDREESLEEQLAWLDAIKETEEAPVRVSASSASTDDSVVSPYPKDPWSLVPQHDTPTPPLFRAAVDSVYGAAAAGELPEAESEAGEWLDKAAVKDEPAKDEPAEPVAKDLPTTPPTSLGKAADEFLAPLKPLPRPDDTDTYSLLSLPEQDKPEQDKPEQETQENIPWPLPPAWSREPQEKQDQADQDTGPQEIFRLSKDLKAEPLGETQPAADEPRRVFEEPRRHFDEPRRSFDTPQQAFDRPQRPADEPRRLFDEPIRPAEEPQRFFDDPKRSFDEPEPEAAPEPAPPAQPESRRPSDEPQRAFGESQHAFGEPSRPFDESPRPASEPRHRQSPEFQRPAEPRHRPAPIPVFNAPPRPPVTGRPNADSLDPESLLRGRRNAPSKGWRRLVYKASGGWIKPGEPPEVRRRRELMARARTPVAAGHHRVAVLSLKGGVGKTTTTVGLGATLAHMRGDRVIAIDANPDRGTLSDKLVLETSATVRDLLNEHEQVKRYVDIRAFTSQAPSRLEVLASDRDPSVSEAFSGADFQAVSQVLENFYSICITDCGTGLLHSAMGGVLGLADQIVLVSSPSVDGARAASATLDWLEAHHYGHLVREATVVLCSVRPRSKSAVDIRKLEAHFAARCRAVIRVPYDPHLEEGAEIDLDRLQETTREAYLQLAAYVGDGFAGTRE
ncbi:MinD/ParA family ATP-binding protein [Nonomuraea sp. LPB2021202275-12-8]|uniref:MinD/ParA family ATP-binding protein n=1 Tax=Nonomuraea sp. LPB2021202275-12-8 TaxID=3120159 RepID=UPI00300C698D